ncbi:hypothetical protein FRC01_006414 [Tulasnella sp. 417]|nr:hypothetical protein FRC01_006414 [Tulasnella sp. 417]
MADVQLLAPAADIPALNSNDPASSEPFDPSTETIPSQTGSSDPLRPPICYDRRLLLHLSKSTLVVPPKDMPAFSDWFGFRRDGDEAGDLPAREPSSRPARPTFSQPSQMGSFRHQSTLSTKLDSTADKDGHERLRNLSDRFDRDRLRSMSGDQSLAGLPQSANRRERDAPPLNPSHRQGSSGSLSANPTGRRDTRASDREPIRPNGSTRSAIHERTSTLTTKELSETRNDRSDDWRRADRWDDRDRPPRERHTEARSRERGWESYDKSDKRSRSREPRDRRGGWDVYGDKDKDPWYRSSGGRDDDRRKEDEAPIVPLRSTRRDRDRDRERDKEPAWMDDWPDSAPAGGKGLVLGAVNGEDKLQAWKKSMKEKDSTPSALEPSAQETDSPSDLQDGLNDIERFKLQMKQAQVQNDLDVKAPTPPTVPQTNGAPPGLNGLPSDPAIVSAPPPTLAADPAIVSASTPGSAVPSPSPHPVGVDGRPVGLGSIGLPAAQTSSGSSTPNPNPDSASLFQTLFNQNPPFQPGASAYPPQDPPPNLTPIDVKPTAQNVFASFLNEPRHSAKPNGISSNTSSVIRSPDIDPPLSSAASATSTGSRAVPPQNLPLLSGAGAGGRTSKFAKFFSQQPPTPKDESGPTMSGLGSGLPPSNGASNPLLSHQSQPSLGGRDPMSLNLGNMGLPPLNGPISGLPNGVGNGMGLPNGMMGLGQQPSGLPFPQQGGLPPMPPHQQPMFSPNDTADRFVADNLVPGLRPQRPRESSLSLGGGGLYGPDMDNEREQLARQLQSLHMGGVNGAGLPPLGPPLHQQQLFEQRQQLARQQQQQQQTLYANQGQNQNRNVLAGMMNVGNGVVPGMGRPTPSPIGNQNPALMQQRGQPQQQQQPRDLNIGLMNLGLGGGMRTPQELVGAGGLGQPRTPQELAHAGLLRGAGGVDLFGANQQQGQFAAQQGRLANLGNFGALGGPGAGVANAQPGGPATGPLNVPSVGAPGTADYALHTQQLQAARANAAAQQQAQMMHNLGIRPGPLISREGLPGPPQGQQGQQQRIPGGQPQQMMGGAGPLDGFIGAGTHPHLHGNIPGGPPSHLPQGNAEQFLQLFLGANAGRGE